MRCRLFGFEPAAFRCASKALGVADCAPDGPIASIAVTARPALHVEAIATLVRSVRLQADLVVRGLRLQTDLVTLVRASSIRSRTSRPSVRKLWWSANVLVRSCSF